MTTTIDAIIILGKGVYADGSIPLIVQQEIKTAVQMCRNQRPRPMFIFSGKYWGLQKNPSTLTEAAAMQHYALQQGIDRRQLLLEDQSLDTIGNALFCKIILDQHDWKNIVVFCTTLHLPRVRYIFQRMYDDSYHVEYRVTSQPVSRGDYWHSLCYEWVATAYAHWLLRHSWSNTTKLHNYIQHHHFMYHRNTLKTWLQHRLRRPIHRHPLRQHNP